MFYEVNQENCVSKDQILLLINEWINNSEVFEGKYKSGFNSSIRLINWLKILQDINHSNKTLNRIWENLYNSMQSQFIFILKNLEFHIPGNHLVFQLFALWIISYFSKI